MGGNITSFKVAFFDSRINLYRCHFRSYKADFEVQKLSKTGDFQEVFIPWSAFSDHWSPYTGEHTKESPPSKASLRSITQLQIWTEGVLGDFNLHLQHIRASTGASASAPPVAGAS